MGLHECVVLFLIFTALTKVMVLNVMFYLPNILCYSTVYCVQPTTNTQCYPSLISPSQLAIPSPIFFVKPLG